MMWGIEFLEEAEKDMKKLDHSGPSIKRNQKGQSESIISGRRRIWKTVGK